MSPTDELQYISNALDVAKDYNLEIEVLWSALNATGTVKDRMDHGLNEWIK